MDAKLNEALRRLTTVLEELKIPYFVGGSLASSIHGAFRATADVDLVASIQVSQAEHLAKRLSPDFYADQDVITDSLKRRRAFNLIYIPAALKFDLFPLTADPFHQSELQRRVQRDLPHAQPQLTLPFASPEDILLAKLAWFREGGDVSDRQWNDITQLADLNRSSLDRAYLRQWAAHLRVADLLERVLPSD